MLKNSAQPSLSRCSRTFTGAGGCQREAAHPLHPGWAGRAIPRSTLTRVYLMEGVDINRTCGNQPLLCLAGKLVVPKGRKATCKPRSSALLSTGCVSCLAQLCPRASPIVMLWSRLFFISTQFWRLSAFGCLVGRQGER